MTRINCVPVRELHDKHLLAEYRELPRVFKLAYAAYARGEGPAAHPAEYTLGKGHVKFFYTRLWWLAQRFDQIYLELRQRGFQPQYSTVPVVPRMPQSWHRGWCPTPEALAINRQRIQERLPKPRR
jgi:hypothetical protein